MSPASRGSRPRLGSYSKSTPNLLEKRNYDAFPGVQQRLPPKQDGDDNNANVPHSVEENRRFLTSYDDDSDSSSGSSSSGSMSVSTSSGTAAQLLPQGNKPAPKRPLYSQLSRSHSSLGHSIFAPPFYNRPPTPLPPSPSLTSLLRPSFSSSHFPSFSRPSTPDSSDTEAASTTIAATITPGAANTLASVVKSARTATPVARASPRVPTYEYYGFALHLGSSLAFLIYVLWSYLPTPFLHRLGIYYYPDRWWSLAVPAWVVMGLVYIYVALASYNVGYLTLGLSNVENLVDAAANVAVVDERGRIVRKGGRSAAVVDGGGGACRTANQKGLGIGERDVEMAELDWATLWNEGTDAVMDIPIGGVCEVLYGAGRLKDLGSDHG